MTGVYYSDDTLTLLLGDASEVLAGMDAGSVNCCVTSPPYYGLRDYEGNPDQIGLEQTPGEYVAALVDVFAEVRQVLADDGTLWLNLGDSYNAIYGGRRALPDATRPRKALLFIPEQVVLALMSAGWIVRNKIAWVKPNARPEPVRDRLSTRHESLYLLVKSERYRFDLDAIRVPHASSSIYHQEVARRRPHEAGKAGAAQTGGVRSGFAAGLRELNPNGANPGDVWEISTRPFKGAHFAPFPIDLPKRCIAAGCPPEGVVLDPFSGAGTTLMAARELGHLAIGIDINAKYHDIALRRMADAPLPFGEVS